VGPRGQILAQPVHPAAGCKAGRWAAVAAAACLTLAADEALAGMVQIPQAVPARIAAASWERRAAADEVVPMAVALSLRNQAGLDALIAAQQDSRSRFYRRWLTPAEFAARFGAAPADYAAIVGWLETVGFTVRTWPSRTRVDFTGPVARIERAFGVRMSRYQYRGHSALATADPPQLPANLAAHIAFLRLDTFSLARPLVRIIQAGSNTDAMDTTDMQVAYDALPVLQRGIDGSGQTVAVVGRSDFLLSDVTQFQQQFGTVVRAPVKTFPGGNPGIGSVNDICAGIRGGFQRQQCIQGEEQEVVLDAEWANALAPGATVLVDISDADIDQSLADIVNHHADAKVVSMSFGDCERLYASERALFAPLYAQAAAQGQTVLVASGDNGVDDCQDGRGASTDVLASDANVTAVGGTALDPGFDANGAATGHVSETVWNDTAGASGGGPSVLVTKPSYQQAPGVPADGARDVPDVALLASPLTAGYVTVVEGAAGIIGGTSAAVQAWAGIVTLLEQAAGANGFGSFNATLYAQARAQYGGEGPAVFYDVTSGNNSFDRVQGYTAGRGYDLVTGLGAPDVAALAQALAGPVTTTATPSPTVTPTRNATPTAAVTPTATPTPARCVGDCGGTGTVGVADVITLVNIALGSTGVAACPTGIPGGVQVDVGLIIQAVDSVLNGCPA
jgi:subtilase family serine protease